MVQFRLVVVLVAGLEPARVLSRGILSPLRLPIPPHERIVLLWLAEVSFCQNFKKRCYRRRSGADIVY